MSSNCSICEQYKLPFHLFSRGQCWNRLSNCFIDRLLNKTLEWTNSGVVVGADTELMRWRLRGTLSYNHLLKRNNFESLTVLLCDFSQKSQFVAFATINGWTVANSSISSLSTNLFICFRFRKGGYAAKQKMRDGFYERGERIGRASVVKNIGSGVRLPWLTVSGCSLLYNLWRLLILSKFSLIIWKNGDSNSIRLVGRLLKRKTI